MALLLALLAGCAASVSVTPDVAVTRVGGGVLTGRLLYRGEPEYVPRTLRSREDAEPIFVYSISTITHRGDLPILGQLFPLGALGVPTRRSVVTASATLEIRSRSRQIAAYRVTAEAAKLQNLYSSDALPELTRLAKLALRSNLDAQLINDLPSLSQALPR